MASQFPCTASAAPIVGASRRKPPVKNMVSPITDMGPIREVFTADTTSPMLSPDLWFSSSNAVSMPTTQGAIWGVVLKKDICLLQASASPSGSSLYIFLRAGAMDQIKPICCCLT